MPKAILFGALWWMVVLVEVSILGITPGLAIQGEYGFTLQPAGILLHGLAVALFASAFSRLYFRGGEASRAFRAKTALTIVAVGLLLDAMVTVPFFVRDFGVFFSKWTLWVGISIFAAVFSTQGMTGSSAKQQ